jgi:hypothetical protein
MLAAMRWVAIWLLLTGTYCAGWAFTAWCLGSPPVLDGTSVAQLLAVPLAQTAALRGLAAFRRMFRER